MRSLGTLFLLVEENRQFKSPGRTDGLAFVIVSITTRKNILFYIAQFNYTKDVKLYLATTPIIYHNDLKDLMKTLILNEV